VYFDFVDSPNVNAFAFEADSTCFIGITSGAIRSLYAVVRHMLAVPTVLAWIGNPNLEAVPSSCPKELSPDIRPISAEWFAQPHCAVRRDYAEHIVNLIFTFLVSHELAHLVQGHCAYSLANFGRRFISEMTQGQEAPHERLTSQTMEVVADCTAAGIMTHVLRDCFTGQIKVHPHWQQFYRDPGRSLADWAFAMTMTCGVFCGEPYDGQIDTVNDHPHWRLRQLQLLLTPPTIVKSFWPEVGIEACNSAMYVGRREAEEAFQGVMGRPRFVDNWGDTRNVGKEHFSSVLRNHWNGFLKDDLKKYSYDPALPIWE
jgi:hypothetical protein